MHQAMLLRRPPKTSWLRYKLCVLNLLKEEVLTYLESLCYQSVERGPVGPGTNRH